MTIRSLTLDEKPFPSFFPCFWGRWGTFDMTEVEVAAGKLVWCGAMFFYGNYSVATSLEMTNVPYEKFNSNSAIFFDKKSESKNKERDLTNLTPWHAWQRQVFQRNARFSEGADPVPELGAADLELEKVYDFYEQPGRHGHFGIVICVNMFVDNVIPSCTSMVWFAGKSTVDDFQS